MRKQLQAAEMDYLIILDEALEQGRATFFFATYQLKI